MAPRDDTAPVPPIHQQAGAAGEFRVTAPDGAAAEDAAGNSPGRRALIGGGLASVLALLLEQVRPAPAGAQEAQAAGNGLCEGTLIQLSQADASAFLQRQLSTSPSFMALHDQFTSQNFNFMFERAKAFLYSAHATEDFTPNLLGILPSFTPVKRTDPFHLAVGIVVNHRGLALAGGVKVQHNPFMISEFRVFELDPQGQIMSHTIAASELATLTLAQAADQLGAPTLPTDRLDPEVNAPSSTDEAIIAARAFRQILLDRFARPLYPRAGLNSLLKQTPLVQKFALVNDLRYAQAFRGISFCCTTSCCNACTSTSTSSTFGSGAA